MGKKSGPPAPDYTQAAEKTAASDQKMLMSQTEANRPNVVTPWGTQTWNKTGTVNQQAYNDALANWTTQQKTMGGSDGVWSKGPPKPSEQDFMSNEWTQTVKLSPAEQKALDSEMAIKAGRTGAAQTLLGQATGAFKKPTDWSQFSDRGELKGGFAFGDGNNPNALRERAQESAWQMMKPALDQQREGTEAKLANMGLARGSEAWNRESQRMDDSVGRARMQAMDAGRMEADQLFRQGIQGVDQANQIANQQNTFRQGEIQEDAFRRSQSLNELNALLTGQQVNMPGFNTGINGTAGRAAAVDYSGAANSQFSAGMQKQQMANDAIGDIAGAAGSMMMFSDARLKYDIRYTGDSLGGVPVVHYRYRGLPGLRVGVIAQDALRLRPETVALHPSGYLMVDYQELAR
jgi:hypothetical protein